MMIRGKNLKATAHDISEGFVAVNPLYLKPLDAETLVALHRHLVKFQNEVRGEKFPYSDVQAIRKRNMRLSKLHSSAMIIRNFARTRSIIIL